MELIVKFGADQQNLKDTVNRMVKQFQSSNVSMPISWQAQAQANATYGRNVAGGGGGGEGGGELPGVKDAANAASKRIVKMLWVQVAALMKDTLIQVLDDLGVMFWENVYGTWNFAMERAKKQHAVLAGKVKKVGDSQKDFDEKVRESVIENSTPGEKVRLLKEDRFKAAEEMEKRQKALDEARADLAGAQRGDFTDINGNKISAEQRQQFTAKVADAEIALNEAREKNLKVSDRLRKAADESVKESIEANKKKQEAEEKAAKDEISALNDEFAQKPNAFEADTLAQAGLFAGSALLMNPDMSVEQEQLDVLREIAGNTGKGGMFQP